MIDVLGILFIGINIDTPDEIGFANGSMSRGLKERTSDGDMVDDLEQVVIAEELTIGLENTRYMRKQASSLAIFEEGRMTMKIASSEADYRIPLLDSIIWEETFFDWNSSQPQNLIVQTWRPRPSVLAKDHRAFLRPRSE